MPRLTDQTALETPDRLDVIHVVDVSDVTDNEAGSSKKVALQHIPSAIPAEIKTAYESNANTNVFTDVEKTKLTGIEEFATADMSDAEIKTAYENNPNTNPLTDVEKLILASLSESGTVSQGSYNFMSDMTKTWEMGQWEGYKALLITDHGNYEVSITFSGISGIGFEPPVGAVVSDSSVTIDDTVESGVLTVVGAGELEGASGNDAAITISQGSGDTGMDTVTWDSNTRILSVVIDSDGAGNPRPIMAGDIEYLINEQVSWLFTATMTSAGNLVAGTYTLSNGVDGNMANGTYYIYGVVGKARSTIASGSQVLGTDAIADNACAELITVPAAGVLSSDIVSIGYNSSPIGKVGYDPTAGWELSIRAFPTENNINILVCNNTGASVTPDAMTVNWRVVR